MGLALLFLLFALFAFPREGRGHKSAKPKEEMNGTRVDQMH